MKPSGQAEGRATRPASPATSATQPADSNPGGGRDVDHALGQIRRWERASRLVADDPALTIKAKCFALLDMMARARRSESAAFLETAIWRGCRHLFEEDTGPPTNTIDAIRRLRHQGHVDCPTCRRPLPGHDVLDYWRELTHDLRRPA